MANIGPLRDGMRRLLGLKLGAAGSAVGWEEFLTWDVCDWGDVYPLKADVMGL